MVKTNNGGLKKKKKGQQMGAKGRSITSLTGDRLQGTGQAPSPWPAGRTQGTMRAQQPTAIDQRDICTLREGEGIQKNCEWSVKVCPLSCKCHGATA